ncbi:MAG TPA: carbohydrate ABC transporter permease [Gaiellaceae bacterium]|nr:carbohydrate ABC transporter permease [Gaiellaceae bacterium]
MTAHRFGRVLSYIVLIVIGLVGLLPFLYLLLLSTKSRLDILEVPPSLDFDWATIKANYAEVIHEDGYFTFVKNSVIVTGVSTLIALVLGVPAGYAFSRLRFRGSETWASTILSFRFMPPVAVAIPIYLMIRYVGLLDSYPGLILPYVAFSLPLVVWIMIGFFDEIPREIDEAAMVDGLTRPFVLLKVLLPLARPGILVAATFGVIFIWNEFLVGLYVINSQDHYTIPIAASSLLTVESPIDWNIAAATGIFTVIPILLFSIVVQRYIVRGITAGAVR